MSTEQVTERKYDKFVIGWVAGILFQMGLHWLFTPINYYEVYASKTKCESSLPRNVECTFQPPK